MTSRGGVVLVLLSSALTANLACRDHPVDRTQLPQLIAQLEGGRCAFHSQPTDERLDNSCKRHDRSTWGMRLFAGRHQCAKWAADCLAELGESAQPVVEALIAAFERGPNNYDTGDGVIPVRDAIARALGSSRDPRALDPLLDALDHPRPVEAGPGAAGYASSEPVGRTAALEGLARLGPVATPAVPAIIDLFSQPVESASDGRRFRAAAAALAAIGDRRGVEALIAWIELAPDAEGNEAVRQAVRRVAGRDAARELKPNYAQQLTRLSARVTRAAKQRGVPPGRVSLSGVEGLFAHEWSSGHRLRVTLDRERWVARREVAGRIGAAAPGTAAGAERFESLAEFDRVLDAALAAIAE